MAALLTTPILLSGPSETESVQGPCTWMLVASEMPLGHQRRKAKIVNIGGCGHESDVNFSKAIHLLST